MYFPLMLRKPGTYRGPRCHALSTACGDWGGVDTSEGQGTSPVWIRNVASGNILVMLRARPLVVAMVTGGGQWVNLTASSGGTGFQHPLPSVKFQGS